MTSHVEHGVGREGEDRHDPLGPQAPSPDPRPHLRETYAAIADGQVVPPSSCCVPGLEAASDPTVAPGPPSLGCGDPVSLASLTAGLSVLDLGCGAGFDCFRAAERVGESGHVIGVDMTPAMLARARANRERLNVRNVEFRLAEIEHLPVADGSIDVALSNCVISLSPDRTRVFREAHRVLKPGGLLAVCDMMIDGRLPDTLETALGPMAKSVCAERDYVAEIEAAGFVDIEVEREYPNVPREVGHVRTEGRGTGARAVIRVAETGESRIVDLDPAQLEGCSTRSFRGRIRARKPGTPRTGRRRETREGRDT